MPKPPKGADAPKFKHPAKLVDCAKRVRALDAAIEKLQVKLAPLTAERTSLTEHLLTTFKKTELDGFRSQGLVFSLVNSVVPTIDDWDKFIAFAKLKGNADLLQRSVNSPAWRARLEAGKAVPGVTPFKRISLRIAQGK